MSTLPDLAPLVAQLHPLMLTPALYLPLRGLRALLVPVYRLYVHVADQATPVISNGINQELNAWFASRQRRRLARYSGSADLTCARELPASHCVPLVSRED